MTIALDATYSVGTELSGVGIYSRELLDGLAASHPEAKFHHLYRSHRILRSCPGAANVSRGLLTETLRWPAGEDLFHALNQRMPQIRFRRSVCTFHDLLVLTGTYSSADFRERFAHQARQAAERADLIVTVSQFTANCVSELLGVDPGRLRVVHHGIRWLGASLVSRQPIVLTVGAVQHRKNIARLVDAFESVPEPWRLVIAGAATGWGAEEILDRIRTSPAYSRIEVTGYVSTSRLADLYSRAMVFAFPSLDEGFGMPVLEAMAAGVPVLSSNRSALPEVCGDAALLVDPLRTEAIAEALQRLCSEEDLRTDLRERGFARASEFTWETAVQKTWRVYRELIGDL